MVEVPVCLVVVFCLFFRLLGLAQIQNEGRVNVGPPSVTLAHIQRGEYWANVGSAS